MEPLMPMAVEVQGAQGVIMADYGPKVAIQVDKVLPFAGKRTIAKHWAWEVVIVALMARAVEAVIRVVMALWDMDQNKNADGLVMMVVWLAAAVAVVAAAAVLMVGLVAPEVQAERVVPMMPSVTMPAAGHTVKVPEGLEVQGVLLMGVLPQKLLIMVPVAPAPVAAAEVQVTALLLITQQAVVAGPVAVR